MSALLEKLPEEMNIEIFEFLYDRPLKKKVLNELLNRTKCIACTNYLSPKFCKNGANFCSLVCYNDPTKEGYLNYFDEYLEELDYLDRRYGSNISYYGP
jgi:hypothetical protein